MATAPVPLTPLPPPEPVVVVGVTGVAGVTGVDGDVVAGIVACGYGTGLNAFPGLAASAPAGRAANPSATRRKDRHVGLLRGASSPAF